VRAADDEFANMPYGSQHNPATDAARAERQAARPAEPVRPDLPWLCWQSQRLPEYIEWAAAHNAWDTERKKDADADESALRRLEARRFDAFAVARLLGTVAGNHFNAIINPMNTTRVADEISRAAQLDFILETEADIVKGSDTVDITDDPRFVRTWCIEFPGMTITASSCLPVRTLHAAIDVGSVLGSTAVPAYYCPHCSLCFGMHNAASIKQQHDSTLNSQRDILVRVCPANPEVHCYEAVVLGRAHRGVQLATQSEKHEEWSENVRQVAAAAAEKKKKEAREAAEAAEAARLERVEAARLANEAAELQRQKDALERARTRNAHNETHSAEMEVEKVRLAEFKDRERKRKNAESMARGRAAKKLARSYE
jgi:hypothetical protein